MSSRSAPLDSRDYITPEAFSVKPELLGLPLAKPRKRLFAWCVDALIVAMVAALSNIVLALALAFLFDRILRQTRFPLGEQWRQHLRVGLVIVFAGWAAMQAYSQWNARHDKAAAARAAKAAPAVAPADVPALVSKADEQVEAALRDAGADSDDDDDDKDSGKKPTQAQHIEHLEDKVDSLQEKLEAEKSKQGFSLIDTMKNVLGDVGFDFGWAAVYWTLLTGWWNGQTLGKRLFGLRVLQLDGRPFSTWDSFNRCGGYAAGVATGLLGFAQVYWDPNRQMIHDKVSFTVVIDEKRERISWPIESTGTPLPPGEAKQSAP